MKAKVPVIQIAAALRAAADKVEEG